MRRLSWVMAGLLVAGALAYLVLPLGETGQTVLYIGVAACAVVTGWAALVYHRPVRRTGWTSLLTGYSLWVLGDILWGLETQVWGLQAFPAFSDVLYLSGYGFLVVGVETFVRSRLKGRDLASLLDAAIVTAGVAVPAVAFVIIPGAADSTMGSLGRLVITAYPIGDLLILAVLLRLVLAAGVRSMSALAVTMSLLATFTADVWWNLLSLTDPDATSLVLDTLWLGGYVLLTAALLHPSMHSVAEGAPVREPLPSLRRLAALTVGSLLPAVTLLVAGLRGGPVPWLVISIGGALLTVLVVVRMAGLLDRVRQQAVQLAALARRDDLTGAPNRRTWDHELSRACALARDTDETLCVAILDLDHFKAYNDRHGHPAGDRVLREAVAAWTRALGPENLLARYGGEEFAVLMPGVELADAAQVLDRLRHVTPHEQTFSAGVARWEPGTAPGDALLAADGALYDAKRSGRDRVVMAGALGADLLPPELRALQIEVQPITDPATGRVVGHEALARFPHDDDVLGVFEQAHRDGLGDLLEGTALLAALQLPGRPARTDLFVNVSGGALRSERFWAMLPDDLQGIVVELVEDRSTVDWHALRPRLDQLQERGARLAVDDLGSAGGDLARLLTIQPQVVKIDRMVVSGCANDDIRLQLVRVVIELAHAAGAVVCAEGIDNDEDLAALMTSGIDMAQGPLVGRPGPQWAQVPLTTPGTTPVVRTV